MAGNPRNGRRYRRLGVAQKALGLPYWVCGRDIDPTLDARDRWSFTLDHAVPLSKGGSLLDPRSAHRRCNSARGNRLTVRQPRTSRRW
ncbi:hypothetical protein [Streptomyces himastatinicus]|uniref:hypothetical protein n=1 Tax=Streptomyces himastatinicus TaxID=998084 RepID=UPI0001B4B2D0|nr:hypothetical protein [Streptomyces himastatinicus]